MVRWGDQTWEEMAIAFFEVAVPVGHDFLEAKRSDDPPLEDKLIRAREKTDALFRRFDANRNQRILPDEVPITFAVFGFHQLDENEDGAITWEESSRATLESLRKKKLSF